MAARRAIVLTYSVLAIGLALSACAPPTNVRTPSSSALRPVPVKDYLLRAMDGSWYVFIEMHSGQGTISSAAYDAANNQVSVDSGSVTLSNGLMDVIGITNIPWFAKGCSCRYQQASSSTLIVSISTNSGIQQWRFNPADISEYNAGVQALNGEEHIAAAASAAAAAEAATHAIMAKEEATCQKVGGTWSSSSYLFTCRIDYRSPAYGSTDQYIVKFDAGGTVIPDACRDAAFFYSNDCTSNQESAQQAQTDCLNGSANFGKQGYWHADTDICA
jgi:hypothetical protein